MTLPEIINSGEVIEPETLRQLHPSLSEEEFNQLMALLVLRNTRHFWENFVSFENIVLALNKIVPDFTKVEGCSPEQIWYALDVAKKLYPDREFTEEILAYIRAMFNDAGVFVYPPHLGLDNPYYEKALKKSKNGPFPLSDDTPEDIQAHKLLAISMYLDKKSKE